MLSKRVPGVKEGVVGVGTDFRAGAGGVRVEDCGSTQRLDIVEVAGCSGGDNFEAGTTAISSHILRRYDGKEKTYSFANWIPIAPIAELPPQIKICFFASPSFTPVSGQGKFIS